MTDRELLQQALDALEHLQTDVEWQYKSPTRAMLRKIEKALRARLAQPEPILPGGGIGRHPDIQARKEGDLIVADLPQVPRGSGGISKDAEPMIDGWPLWSGLPQIPKGGGGVSEEMLKKVVDKLPTMPIKVAENPTKPTKVMIIPALLEQAGYVKKKEWLGLTEDEIYEAVENSNSVLVKDMARAIEAKLKEKNT
jgi:hypothetical protein